MILSYLNIFEPNAKRTQVKATITTNASAHSASSYGQPVIVLADGEALDLTSWGVFGYQAEVATKKEQAELQKMGLSVNSFCDWPEWGDDDARQTK